MSATEIVLALGFGSCLALLWYLAWRDTREQEAEAGARDLLGAGLLAGGVESLQLSAAEVRSYYEGGYSTRVTRRPDGAYLVTVHTQAVDPDGAKEA